MNLIHGEQEILNFWKNVLEVARKIFPVLSQRKAQLDTLGRQIIHQLLKEETNISLVWRRDMERYFEAMLVRWW